MATKAFITGVAGHALTSDEQFFLREHDPWGLIVFARNIDTPDQVRALTASFRETVGRADAPVLVDQEGGRVQRLRPPHWTNYPSATAVCALYDTAPEKAHRAAWLMGRLHAFDLLPLGLTVNCLPVLDVPVAGSSNVIGDRAWGTEPEQVAKLGTAQAAGLMAGGVMPVMKHMPGHGRGMVDSHYDLPVVDASLEDLKARDFVPFCGQDHIKMAMTGHLIFTAIDPDNPATTSKAVLEDIMRSHMGFDGLIMTDDLSMNALSGDFADRCHASFAAGCDVVLHCNGEMEEMLAVAKATPALSGKALDRAQDALIGTGAADGLSEKDCREEFAELTAGFVAA
ncbi:MAG: beta-N-acetylhexosaminidase [Pseudomonadota bacterium]